jgi:hypothetical protein
MACRAQAPQQARSAITKPLAQAVRPVTLHACAPVANATPAAALPMPGSTMLTLPRMHHTKPALLGMAAQRRASHRQAATHECLKLWAADAQQGGGPAHHHHAGGALARALQRPLAKRGARAQPQHLRVRANRRPAQTLHLRE